MLQNKLERLDLDVNIHAEFNTYRNWGRFLAYEDPIIVSDDEQQESANWAVKSLFNSVKAVSGGTDFQNKINAPLLDTPETRSNSREFEGVPQDCSIRGLVNASKQGQLGRQIYNYADFMYCKHLGRLSNNYLITLRRFPYPCGDHINLTFPGIENSMTTSTHSGEIQAHMPDIGRLITWLGTSGNEMGNILKYSVKLPFSELKSELQEAGDAGGDNGGPLGTFLNATTNSSYQQNVIRGISGSDTQSYMSRIHGMPNLSNNSNPYADAASHKDSSKTYGPLDVITKTSKRETGLEYNHDISLTFDYELRSYDGINGKAAFLDLIANILAVTYATGDFWGGGYRFTGSSQSNIFANLPIYKNNGSQSFSEVLDSFTESGKQIFKSLGGTSEGGILGGFKNILSNIGKGAFSALLGGALNQLGRPKKAALNSLLTPAPVGYWHLTIGNPWHPIMTMGNMIIENTEIEQYGPLGLDDFPTGIKVNVKLKPAKGRDAALIEQLYTMGESRIYTPTDETILNMYYISQPLLQSKKKNNTSHANIDNDNSGGIERILSESLSNKLSEKELTQKISDNIKQNEDVKKMFMLHFGTDDPMPIIIAGKEGGFGSCKIKKKI